MSLFKARDWWVTKAGDDEVFDLGCLTVGNVDNAAQATDKIIVGSHHGVLRIYKPQKHENDVGVHLRFNPQDLLCEIQLSQPILQVEIGKFISGSENLHLAVLHSRKLALYSLSSTSGQVEHGIQFDLKLVHEHNLNRTACNMCHGPFGGVRNRDFICVQSMDGALSIYEQESFAFTRFLPKALIPGPIRYIPKTDSFITVSSCRLVEAYKYKVLAVAQDVKSKEEAETAKGKKVVCEWEFNIGEQAIDIQVVNFENAPLSIYILGERNMYVLTEAGKLRMMKKFECTPRCFLPYASMSEGTINCMVCNDSNQMNIYKDVKLQWAAQLEQVPVQIRVACFIRELRGVIVALSEEGHLHCLYLGTDPSMFTAPTSEVRELDYDELSKEMEQLQKVIRQQQRVAAIDLPTAREEDEIDVTVEIPSDIDHRSAAVECEYEEEFDIPSITVKVTVEAKREIKEVRIALHIQAPIYCSDRLLSYSMLGPEKPAEWLAIFYKKDGGLVPSLAGQITVTYISSANAPRVYYHSFRLPLKLVCLPVIPSKTATYKLTIDTNKAPVSLHDIFPDMQGDSMGGAGNALGFRYYGTQDLVTVLASKTSQRYRLQCDAFENLWLLLDEIVRRLNVYHRTHGITNFKISYDGQLPLQEFYEVMDNHFACRLEEATLQKVLEQRAVQFRAIQKRLLTRFKDKTPTPLANLDTLLNGTYTQLMQIAGEMEENRERQKTASRALGAAVQILCYMVKIWQDLNDTEFMILTSALAPNVDNNSQNEEGEITYGWEEMVDASVTHLLRTCLAKSAKDQTINPSPLVLLKDTQKLKKHIALLCDRLSKGAKLQVEGLEAATPEDDTTPMMKDNLKKRSATSVGKAPSLDDFNRGGGGSRSSLENGNMSNRAGGLRGRGGLPEIPQEKAMSPATSQFYGTGTEGSHLDPDDADAAPFIPGERGNRFMKQPSQSSEMMESPSARSMVPDLDELTSEDTMGSQSKTGELVYGLSDELPPLTNPNR